MQFDLKAGFIGPAGDVAVRPSMVVLVLNAGTGCELMLAGGSFIALNSSAEHTARSLWGLITASDNGYFNPDHVMAVTPYGEGSRIHLTNNVTLDTVMPPHILIDSLSDLDALRRDLGVHSSGRQP